MSKKVKKERYTKEELFIRVKEIFTSNPLSRIKTRDLYILLDVNQRRDKYLITEAVEILLSEEHIREVKNGVFMFNNDNVITVQAKIVQIARNALYAKAEGYDEDIYIDSVSSKNALVGDIVNLIVASGRNAKGRIEAVISEVVTRSKQRFSGIITLTRNFGFVDVDSSKMPYDILVPGEALNGAQNGQKVLAEIVEWPEGGKNPVGMVVKVFGNAGDNDAEMHAILAEYDLPYNFESAIEKYAEQISDKITKSEISKRRDMRGVPTCTIDPFDAKDFDDALSLRVLENGNYEVGVHIADVSHYVKEDSILDKEAYSRATSVYLVDRVVPMLPEVLSNGLCSLRPNEEKLTFSVVFEINNSGEVVNEWIGRTVILSDRRFTYQEAQDIIEGGDGDMKSEILDLDRIAKILREKRFKNGAMAFERDEAKFNLDENGKPIGVYFKEMKDSNHLVEEFMLLANRTVAEFVGKRPGHKKTFVYRIHDKPDGEKFKSFSEFAAKFGYIMRAKTDRAIGRELNKFLGEIKGTRQENLFSTLALRTMSKASYSTTNIGHYGLAFDYYSHFTSPIRRYPDIMVHRLLDFYLSGGKSANKDTYQEHCEHSSQREILAAEAERSSIKYKMVEFLSDKIGEEFVGYVSGVSEWGVYVEIEETKIEGMISVRSMKDDFYQFDPENYKMVGMRHRRSLTIGDKVMIKVLRADLQRKQLDYELVAFVDYETGVVKRIQDNSHLKSRTKLTKKRR